MAACKSVGFEVERRPSKRLKGWNLGFYPIRVAEDYRLLKATGANVVRSALLTDLTKQWPDTNQVLQQCEFCKDNNLTLIVAVFINPNPVAEDGLWVNPELQANFIRLWYSLATVLVDYRSVIFDLMNEPRSAEWFGLSVQAIEAVRSIDPQRTIMIEYPEWSVPDSFRNAKPLLHTNVIYSAHMYAPHEFTHQGLGYPRGITYAQGTAKANLQALRDFQLQYGVSIFIGEVGCIRWAPDREEYLREVLDVFDEYGWGWAFHAWREWEGWDAELPLVVYDLLLERFKG